MFSCHIIIAQTDYNKIDERQKKWSLERFYKDLKDPGMRGLSSMEKKLEFSIL
jgi:hypothetical protein